MSFRARLVLLKWLFGVCGRGNSVKWRSDRGVDFEVRQFIEQYLFAAIVKTERWSNKVEPYRIATFRADRELLSL